MNRNRTRFRQNARSCNVYSWNRFCFGIYRIRILKKILECFGDLKNYRQEFKIKKQSANNVIGIIKGKSKLDEIVVFSAHYDHLGMVESGKDKIYNGANDDLYGVTAIIALAKHYQEMNINVRTLIFAEFTGE